MNDDAVQGLSAVAGTTMLSIQIVAPSSGRTYSQLSGFSASANPMNMLPE